VEIRPYQDHDQAGLIALWTEIFPAGSPHNDPATSLDKKLRTDPDLLLVSVKEGRVVASVMGGYDRHRGCFKGNLQVLSPNATVVELCKELGYKVEERISMGKKLYK
jgi:hypothetical protein